VSGRTGTGSGSFGSGRTAGYAIGEGRTSPWLEAIAGIRERPCPRLVSKWVNEDSHTEPWTLIVYYRQSSGIPRSKTRGLMAPRAKTAKIWPGHILKLQSVPNPKSPKN